MTMTKRTVFTEAFERLPCTPMSSGMSCQHKAWQEKAKSSQLSGSTSPTRSTCLVTVPWKAGAGALHTGLLVQEHELEADAM